MERNTGWTRVSELSCSPMVVLLSLRQARPTHSQRWCCHPLLRCLEAVFEWMQESKAPWCNPLEQFRVATRVPKRMLAQKGVVGALSETRTGEPELILAERLCQPR